MSSAFVAQLRRQSIRPAFQPSLVSRLSLAHTQRGHRAFIPRNERVSVSFQRTSIGGARAFSLWGWGRASASSPETNSVAEQPSTPSSSTTPEPTPIEAIATEPSSTVPPSIPDPSTIPTENITESITESITSTISSITPPPPLNYGDLAELGLVSWSPAGFFTWALESVQVSTGLPWWATIMITTIASRAILLPLVLRGMRATARLTPIQPQMSKLREQMNVARVKQDALLLQSTMAKQQKLLKEANVNPFDTLFMSISQIVVQLGFFIGLRRMCSLPVEQLKFGGFGYLTDLTIPDPYYITPVLSTLLVNLQLSLSGKDMAAVGSPSAPHILNGFRILSILGVGFMAFLPAGINVHIITSICFISLQTLLLRHPTIRAKLGLPALPKLSAKQPSFRDTFEFIRASYRGRMDQAIASEEERARKMRMMRK